MMVSVYLKLISHNLLIINISILCFFIITENHDSDKDFMKEYDADNILNLDGQVDLEIITYNDMIEEFYTKAKEIKCSDGTPKEYMAYLVGYKEEGSLIATELIYPEQIGDSGKVEDLSGKIIFEMFPNCKCL